MTVLEAVFIGSPIALVQSCELCHLFSDLMPIGRPVPWVCSPLIHKRKGGSD